MLLLNFALGVTLLFLSGNAFQQWLLWGDRKYLIIAVFVGLAGGFFTVAAIGCAV